LEIELSRQGARHDVTALAQSAERLWHSDRQARSGRILDRIETVNKPKAA